MKKIFCIAFAIFCEVFMVACVEEDAEPIVIGNNVCSYGSYECHDGNSYYCGYPDSSNDVMWIHAETCHNGCDSSTGKCYRNSGSNGGSGDNGSGNNGNNDSSECTSGNFKCIGTESFYCNSLGSWVYDARCEYGCDSSTGKCKNNSSDSSDSGDDHGGSSDPALCVDDGTYRCYDNLRQQCNSGTWKTVEECDYLCNPATQECDDKQGCKSGEYKCIGNYLNYCNNNFWEIKEKCQFGCDSSAKKCIESDCTPGEYICGESRDSGYSYASYYCRDGYWTYNRTCPNNCNTSTGKCYEECTSGEFKCSGDNSMYCRDGFWEKSKSCEDGCDSSTGKCKGCVSGKYKCSDNNSMYCNDSLWKLDKSCENGCDSSTGKCQCLSGEYKCSEDNSMFCKNGFWEMNESCDYGCDSSAGKCKTCYIQIGNKFWSSSNESSLNWQEAKTYCDNLVECGYSDWHLPTISELRTLIQNCPETETGGECGVTDSCLVDDSRCHNDACYALSCDWDYSGKYSKLGDNWIFWSSSSEDTYFAWYVGFGQGSVSSDYKDHEKYVRCVR